MKTKYLRLKNRKVLNEVLYNQNSLYIHKIIKIKLTNRHYNNLLVIGLELKKPIN